MLNLDVYESRRPYFWYVVATTCETTNKPVNFVYKITFLNAGNNQFSWNQMGLLETYTFYFILWIFGFGAHYFSVRQLRQVEVNIIVSLSVVS